MSVLALAEVKDHLKITVDTYDSELQGFLDGAEAAVTHRVGSLEPVAVTARVSGCSDSLVLNRLPVVSLTSVTPVGSSALTLSDLYVGDGGVVTYNLGGSFSASAYTVAYSAGWSPLPDDLRLAVLELVRHLWMSQRGSGSRPGPSSSTELSNTLPGAAFVFPFRVEQLLTPYLLPGFA